MSEQQNPLAEWAKDRVNQINEKLSLEPEQSEPIRLETEGVFDSAGYPLPDEAFIDNPMAALMQPLIQYFESIKPPMAFTTPPKSEHKVRIYILDQGADLQAIEMDIAAHLNDGYCCHMPTVVGDFVIMDFSRRKESEEDGKQ